MAGESDAGACARATMDPARARIRTTVRGRAKRKGSIDCAEEALAFFMAAQGYRIWPCGVHTFSALQSRWGRNSLSAQKFPNTACDPNHCVECMVSLTAVLPGAQT